jgi:CXXX repeat modification system protein
MAWTEKELVGKITDEEKNEIKGFFYRKKSLEELFSILLTSNIDVKNKEIYDRMMEDYVSVTQKFEDWWKIKAVLYNWKNVPGGNWDINFDTNEIFLSYQVGQ